MHRLANRYVANCDKCGGTIDIGKGVPTRTGGKNTKWSYHHPAGSGECTRNECKKDSPNPNFATVADMAMAVDETENANDT